MNVSVRGLVLRKVGSPRRIIDDVSFDCDTGQRVALLGHSGAGKTLLSRSIAGSLPPGVERVAGDILVGHAGSKENCAEKSVVTMVPQIVASALPPLFSTFSLVQKVALWSGGGTAASRTAATKCLEDVGFEDVSAVANRYPFQLSGGMAKRVALAAALATSPHLLVLDEPTAGLDPLARGEIIDLLVALNERKGVGLLVATHDLFLAWSLCSSFLVIREGRLVAQGDAQVLRTTSDDYVHRFLLNEADLPSYGSFGTSGMTNTNSSPAAVEAVDLGVRFPIAGSSHQRLDALVDISFTVEESSSTGIIGSSGSGKTTLAQACAGLLRPSCGRVLHLGVDAYESSGLWSRRSPAQVQMVFQNPFAALNPRRTIRDWLRLVLRRTRGLAACNDNILMPFLEQVGLGRNVLDSVPSQLSGGECQRVCIASALAIEASVLILDEPASMLDPISRRGLIDVLRELHASRRFTYLIVSHDIQFIRDLCFDVLVLSQGRIVERGPVTDVLSRPQRLETKNIVFPLISRRGSREVEV